MEAAGQRSIYQLALNGFNCSLNTMNSNEILFSTNQFNSIQSLFPYKKKIHKHQEASK